MGPMVSVEDIAVAKTFANETCHPGHMTCLCLWTKVGRHLIKFWGVLEDNGDLEWKEWAAEQQQCHPPCVNHVKSSREGPRKRGGHGGCDSSVLDANLPPAH